MKKIKVAILFGGRSTEHQISLLSAQSVINNLDKEKYESVLIGIDKSGRWHFHDGAIKLLHAKDPKRIAIEDNSKGLYLSQNANEGIIVSTDRNEVLSNIDVIFPVLHGTFGEDGSVQGLAKLANIPIVGCGILGSAIGIDKDISKRLLRDAGIDNAAFFTMRKGSKFNKSYAEIAEKLGAELFIKPANLGSSVGVSFVDNEDDFNVALTEAFRYDHKVVVEEKIVGREIECAILGNEHPRASTVGEIIPKSSFYTFENKYVNDDGAALEIPAKLDAETIRRVQELAIKTYVTLECRGLARVDMFLKPNGSLVLNEINTMPGFTSISMYPKLWEYSGLSYSELLSTLIELAIDYQEEQDGLQL